MCTGKGFTYAGPYAHASMKVAVEPYQITFSATIGISEHYFLHYVGTAAQARVEANTIISEDTISACVRVGA